MIIPANTLAPDTLRAVIENVITREGTDYGELEFSLEEKVAQILLLIKHKQTVIVFDEESESVALMDTQEARQQGLFEHDY